MQSIAVHGLLGPFPKEERHKNPHSDQTGTQYKYQSYPDMKSDPQGGNYSLNFVFATKVRKISTALLSYLLWQADMRATCPPTSPSTALKGQLQKQPE